MACLLISLFFSYHLFQNWSNVLSLGALSITAIRTACCRPGSRRFVVTILLRQLSSSCTTLSSLKFGQLVPLVLLDLSLAFDTVDRDYLLSVLWHQFSVDSDAMTWFCSYLVNTHMVHCQSIAACHGAPCWAQLSSSHTLRMCQNSDLITSHGVSCHLFADHKQQYTAVSPHEIRVGGQRLMSCVSDLQEWCATSPLHIVRRTLLTYTGEVGNFIMVKN